MITKIPKINNPVPALVPRSTKKLLMLSHDPTKSVGGELTDDKMESPKTRKPIPARAINTAVNTVFPFNDIIEIGFLLPPLNREEFHQLSKRLLTDF